MQLKVRRLREDAALPRYMTTHAAGMDLCAALDGPVTLAPGARAAISTGIAVEIAAGYEGQVRPRSGLAVSCGVTVLNAPGTIDADYRGEIKVVLVNLGRDPVTIESGTRIAQLVVAPTTRVEVVEVDELTATGRGARGFGHTG